MAGRYIISLDVHGQETEIVVMTETGRVTRRERQPTTVPALLEGVTQVRRPRQVVMEEGPLADWLCRNLSEQVDAVVACDPRRNHLIAKDSDQDDPIDAEKLGHLFRGRYIKVVHHAESWERVIFKDHVGLYHDLKNAILGAAKSAIATRNNPFADEYWRYVTNGQLTPRVARRSVARSQAAVMWGMWKNGRVYEPERVGVCSWAQAAAPLSP